MKRSLQLCIVTLLAASMVFAANERRAQKMAEERAAAAEASSFFQATTTNPLGWTPFDIESATSRYKGIAIVPGGVIWIAGNDNGFSSFYGYRSVDNGATWKKFSLNIGAANGVTNIAAKDSNIAVIGSNIGVLLRTTDGGTTWNEVFSYDPNLAWMDGVVTVGTTRDTMMAWGDADNDGVMVARSLDAGATWTRLTNLPTTDSVTLAQSWVGYYTYGQCMDSYGLNVWISMYWGANVTPRMLVTTDAGETWAVYKNELPGGAAYNYRLHTINFTDATNGWAVCRGLSSSQSNYLVKTTDGGKTWSDTLSVESGTPHSNATPITAKQIRGTNTVFAGGFGTAGAKAWWSTDGGANWANLGIPTGPTVNATVYISGFSDAENGVMAGREVTMRLTPTTAIEDEVSGQPESYSLSQNYPNPFNPSTAIRFSIPNSGKVTLKVYNILGVEVATLIDGELSAGTHRVTFDAANIASGVYFYRIEAGAFSSVRKMALLK